MQGGSEVGGEEGSYALCEKERWWWWCMRWVGGHLVCAIQLALASTRLMAGLEKVFDVVCAKQLARDPSTMSEYGYTEEGIAG